LEIAAKDLGILLRSKHPLVMCETVEEKRFESLVRSVCADLTLPYSSWSSVAGLSPCAPSESEKTRDLAFALQIIRGCRGDGAWLLKDPQAHLEVPATLRALRETAQDFANSPRTLVLVGPTLPKKPELDDIEVRFEFALPGAEELARLVNEAVARMAREDPRRRIQLSREDLAGIASDLSGLTLFEAERALARSLLEIGLAASATRKKIRESKQNLVEDGGLLEFVPAPEGFDAVGGLDRLKKWLTIRKLGFLPRPGAAPLDAPRGILLLGVQGAGKSLAAKAVAASWEVPLLSLDAGRLLTPYIGESERNLREALKRVERMAPCVLWIDEIEKAFAAGRSTESDGGVSKRLLGTLLTWMQERKDRVFLVATANSVDELPPEMMRKGRVDEVFFVDLPGKSARAEIFLIHLKKRGEDPARFDLPMLALSSKGYSGAEIEQVIVSALYETRAAGVPLDTPGILVALRQTRPLSVLRAEAIRALRTWAADRCVPTDTPTND
jgi:SpoVK/Ycf46/Vps4 family AAA+-type ATPase